MRTVALVGALFAAATYAQVNVTGIASLPKCGVSPAFPMGESPSWARG